MKQVYPRLWVLASAVCFGILEGGGHVTFGPPNLWIFVAEWHIPMAVVMICGLLGWRQWQMFPGWILLEDITYWLASGKLLEESSWISFGWGGLHFWGMYLPWLYVALLAFWLGLEWLVRAFNVQIDLTQ